ncbi:MAG TPA: flagellar biosynthesis protein FlhA [Chloroflexota bacterium]|nr:flagellar biosynthesis protein FlhA [Chloroflexota bacterium]
MAVAPAPAAAPTGLSRLLRQSDILLAIAVVAIVVMLIVPLPTLLLDVLITVDISTSILILLLTLYTTQPLELSVFPSMLLIVTLFRLALNVSASRLILLHGNAGEVISAFGNFVVGGNYVVGVVVFLILVIIQFVVITNGAGRVAEVAARFTLDAMPGKQMAIDADLNAGLINEADARKRRSDIQRQADFYGAMDGASKFVRGDAVAQIVLIIVNILGGFAVGVLQQGMPLTQALQTFTLLTVGDGLVSEIPALLVSTATGIIVTRAAAEGNMGEELTRQLLGKPRTMFMVGGLVVAFGLVPGLPKIPFFAIGGAFLALAFTVQNNQRRANQTALALAAGGAQMEKGPDGQPVPKGPESVMGLLSVDPMELEIGYGLIPLVDVQEGGNLLNRITLIRRQTALELGIVVPTIRIRDNLQLPPNTYVIRLRGAEIARGELIMNYYLAMSAGVATERIEGIPATDPAFGLPALWITGAQKERAEILGYTVVDAASVLTTHLTEVIKAHAPDILSRQDVQTLLEHVKKDYSAVVEELTPNVMGVGEIQTVLRHLLRERLSIRDMVTILETLANNAKTNKDLDFLTEQVRKALARSISNQYKEADGSIHVITLSPQSEQTITNALYQTDQGLMISLDPTMVQRLMGRLQTEMEKIATDGFQPILLCSAKIRLPMRRLTERLFPTLVVLSYSEIMPDVEVRSQAVIGFDDEGSSGDGMAA